jgi:ACS family hexuronate transporter-like MFS transporter
MKIDTRFRWVICGLLFLATTINYMDRQVIGILKPIFFAELHWTQTDYGHVMTAFQAAYAIGYLAAGGLIDRIGIRLGFSLAVFLWSLAAMAHGLMRNALQFGVARFALGLAEGANFPAAVKTVGQWFPRQDRALATGIFNAGSNVGALITPLLVPWITQQWGWPAAFFAVGGLGLLWLVLWLPVYDAPERHGRVSPAELAYIRSDPPDPPGDIAWLELLRHRQTWAFVIGMFLCSPIWWFYLFWIPGLFHERFTLDMNHIGPPVVIIYLMTDVGSVGGGWLSSMLLKRGWSVNAARKTAMLVCACCVLPIAAAAEVSSQWSAALLIGLAASAHQGFSANLYTLVSDTMPRKVIGSVVGIGGMAGAVGGMLLSEITGHLLDWTHNNYHVPFYMAALAYPLALLIIHLLLPRLEPMQVAAH